MSARELLHRRRVGGQLGGGREQATGALDVVEPLPRHLAGLQRDVEAVLAAQVIEHALADLDDGAPLAALALHLVHEDVGGDQRPAGRRAVGGGGVEGAGGEAAGALAVLEALQPDQGEATVAVGAGRRVTGGLDAALVVLLELVPALGLGEERLEHGVGRRLVEVLLEDAAQELLEPGILGRLEAQDARGAQEHARGGGVVEARRVLGQPLHLIGPLVGVVVEGGDRVLDPGRVRGPLERALQHLLRLVALAAVEQGLADDRGQLGRGGGALQLHLAELGHHLVAPHLPVDLAGARQRLQVVGVELPRTLVQRERSFALRDHVLGQPGELVEPLRLLRLRSGRLQFLFELVDRRDPVARPAQTLPQQRARIHLRCILPHLQANFYPG